MTIQELLDKQYKIRFKHHRVFRNPKIKNVEGPTAGLLVSENEVDNILTRGEWEHAKAADKLVAYNGKTLGRIYPDFAIFGEYVSPTGGFTELEVTAPDGKVFKSKYNFGKTVPYNRKVGRVATLGRISKIIEK